MPIFNRFKIVLILVISCIAGIGLLHLRFEMSHSRAYELLIWNLFLASIPLIISSLMVACNQWLPALFLLIFAGMWLLFFPNAPYICTDFIHLKARQNVPVWFDALLLFAFAWNGLLLGFVSMLDIQYVMSRRFGKIFAWFFMIVSVITGSFGIYLGRFLRWNSWNILTHPAKLLCDISKRLLHPQAYPSAIEVTLFFSAFLLIAYITIRQIVHSYTGKTNFL